MQLVFGNLMISQAEAMATRNPLFSVPPVPSSSCDIGLNARFIQTQKKSLAEFPKLYAF
jgi:hypothetical protein